MSQPFLWRRVNDSSGFAEPRVFIRVYLEPGSIDAAIAFYEDLQGVAHDMRFDFPEKRLTLAAVGAFLLLEGSDEALAPFRSTTGTLLVDDIEPYHRRLLAAGAQIIFGPARAPTGACFNALAPRISRASLFWLSLNLPTRRVISISMPTISRSISSM